MNRDDLIALLEQDLKNEYTHMLFYLAASSTVRGLHRPELREWLEEEAESEMGHVKEFSRLLVSLGSTPRTDFHPFPTFVHPLDIVQKAIDLEQGVCDTYAVRLEQIDAYTTSLRLRSIESGEQERAEDRREYAAWTRVGLFYEDQLTHSHTDLDELRQWLPL